MHLRALGFLALFAAAVPCFNIVRAADEDRLKKLEEAMEALRNENAQLKARQEASDKKSAELQKQVNSFETHQKTVRSEQTMQKAMDRAQVKVGESRQTCVFLDYDRPDVQGTGLFTTAEFLMLKPHESNQVAAGRDAITGSVTTTGIARAGKDLNLDSTYDPGFRMGVGYRLPKDGWEALLEYTWFRGRADRNLDDRGTNAAITITPPSLNLGFLTTAVHPGGFSNGRVESDTHYSVLDLTAGRNTRISESFSLRPFAGARLMWFDREFKAKFDALRPDPDLPNGQSLTIRRKQDYFGYGPHAGVEGTWKFSHDLSLFGGGSASLLLGDSEHTYSENSRFGIPQVPGLIFGSNFRYHGGGLTVVPSVDLRFGSSWDHKFNCNLHMKVSAGYEFTNYFGMINNQTGGLGFAALNGVDEVIRDHGGNWGVHGFFLKVRFDF